VVVMELNPSLLGRNRFCDRSRGRGLE